MNIFKPSQKNDLPMINNIQEIISDIIGADLSSEVIKEELINALSWANRDLNKQTKQKIINNLLRRSNNLIYSELQTERKKNPKYEEYQELLDETFEKCKNLTLAIKNWYTYQIIFSFSEIIAKVILEKTDWNSILSDQNIQKVKEIWYEFNPQADKKLQYKYKSNSQKKQLKELIEKKYKDFIFYDFNEVLFEEEANKEWIYQKYQESIFEQLDKSNEQIRTIKTNIIFRNFLKNPVKQQNSQNETKTNKQEEEITKIWQTKINLQENFKKWEVQELISEKIEKFSLNSKDKNFLKKFIYRIHKNGKNIKESDFLGDFPQRITILEEDKEKFLDLVQSLGIKIEENSIKNNQNKIENTSISSVEHKEENNIDAEVEDENLDNKSIITVLEKLYEIENKEAFEKQLNVYREKKNNQCSSVFKKMKREDMIKQTVSKGNGLFVIELGWEERIVLEKWNGKLKIIKFLYDHNEYNTFLNSQKY